MLLDSTNMLQTLADSTSNLHTLDRDAYQENPTPCDKISIKRISLPHYACWYSTEIQLKRNTIKFLSLFKALCPDLPLCWHTLKTAKMRLFLLTSLKLQSKRQSKNKLRHFNNCHLLLSICLNRWESLQWAMERCQNQVMSVMSMRGQNIFSKLHNVITPSLIFPGLKASVAPMWDQGWQTWRITQALPSSRFGRLLIFRITLDNVLNR